MLAKTNEDVYTLPNGAIIVQWPEAINQDEIEDVDKFFEMVIRRIKRSVVARPEKPALSEA